MTQVLLGFLKFAVLIAVFGAAGVALGYGLSTVSSDERAPTRAKGGTETARGPTARVTRSATTATATQPAQGTATNPASPPREGRSGVLDVRVLGAILRPAGTPSGIRRKRARITMRVRADNRGSTPVTVDLPRLRIGRSMNRPDSNALTPESRFGKLAAGESKSVTLRFELEGDATAKAIRDRRARIEIAGRSQAIRITIGSPVAPAAT